MRQRLRPQLRILALACVIFVSSALPDAAWPRTSSGTLRLAIDEGDVPEVLYEYKKDACDSHDHPDVPARAFRDADGMIHLLATNYVHRALVGESFSTLRKFCDVVYKPSQIGEPALYDDKAWIQAVYTTDGRTIHALMSSDFHEYRHSQRCPFGRDTNKCWYNAITAAVSVDGGRTFRTLRAPPAHYVAGPSVKYDLNAGRSIGLFTVSNIVGYGRYFHTLVYTGGGFGRQKRGVCLLRTATLDEPSSWRAWDGKGFGHRFTDPYRSDRNVKDDPGCRPVSPAVLSGPVRAVVLHQPTGLFVAVMLAAPRKNGRPVRGVYYTLSRDLIEWSPLRPLLIAPTRAEIRLSANPKVQMAIDYPSIIDHASPGRNFEFLATEPYLYYVELPVVAGKLTGERRLVRRRLTISN